MAPLILMAVLEVPFEKVTVDIVGPIKKSTVGSQYILVLLNCMTRYPEAAQMQAVTAPNIAGDLLKIFARVHLPREMLFNQHSNFILRVMQEICDTLSLEKYVTHCTIYKQWLYHQKDNKDVYNEEFLVLGPVDPTFNDCDQRDPTGFNGVFVL